MIMTFHPADTQGIKERCLALINKGESFSAILVKDDNDQPHHWQIKDGIDATK